MTAAAAAAAAAATSGLRVLVLGSGGREHALVWRLAQDPSVAHVYVAPGNGGTALMAQQKTPGLATVENLPALDASSPAKFPAVIDFAVKAGVGLVVPGPEQPLVDGISDACKKAGLPCFGPSQVAAQLEGSKAFSKHFMARHGIPTARYQAFTKYEDARAHIESIDYQVVIKASGLAAGKGVLLPTTKEEALQGIKSVMVDREFGSAGDEVVIEEFIDGEEVSVLAFSDGYSVALFPGAQDHKRAYDGDQGPNTGGMGCYAPAPVATQAMLDEIRSTIVKPTIDGMRREGNPFVGVLFTGIMVDKKDGRPKVLEYNVRFGDPETEVVLPLLAPECGLAQIMLACAGGFLDAVDVKFTSRHAATIVVASGGYPGSYAKGKTITFGAQSVANSQVFHAGTTTGPSGDIVTSGGRVLAVTGTADTLADALKIAYQQVDQIKFDGAFHRRDIGHRALNRAAASGSDKKLTYADAGVDIDAGNELVREIKSVVRATRRVGADSEIGGFGAVFDMKAIGYADPLLISATDGVGTKLMIAHELGIFDTVGVDLVAMQVNDIIVQGAEPLYFLDYYACGKLDVPAAAAFVRGVAQGCLESGCALVGGETAEMPGMYPRKGEFDAAGFVVGVVERNMLLPRVDNIRPGDAVIGISSSGVHSNGFSLVRKVISHAGLDFHSACPFPTSSGKPSSIGAELLTPTRIYVKPLLKLLRPASGLPEDIKIKAMAHITGGGFVDNIPRVLPKGTGIGVELDAAQWNLPPVFSWLKAAGGIPVSDMARTFNCGIGMVLVAAAEDAESIVAGLKAAGEPNAFVIGKIVQRDVNTPEEQLVTVGNTEKW
ncbi:phosphoribosylamine--glycine ligase [Ramicandelaber brevisporus]|nr:phosphoribosylamine--glycine ligase [Ramicandelaber brevisporus]